MQRRPRSRAPRPWMALVIAVLLVVVLAALVVVIDSSTTTQSITSNGNQPEPSTDAPAGAPKRATTSSTTTTPTTAATVATAAGAPTTNAATKPAFTPTAAVPLRLWVGGDSLAAGPSWAVFQDAVATGVIKPQAEYQVGTGLVRNEFWDWPKHMDAVVRARDPQVSIFMVGANDDQGIDVNGTSVSPPDQAWVDEYRRRVDSLMESMTAGGRRLIWIGMPPMRDAAYSQSMQLVDQVFQQESAKHRRVTYVDVWTLFSAPGSPGTYAQFLPNERGESTDMRLDDGIHLNVEGSQYLSRTVMAALGTIAVLPPS
jgi:hypothetical protein